MKDVYMISLFTFITATILYILIQITSTPFERYIGIGLNTIGLIVSFLIGGGLYLFLLK